MSMHAIYHVTYTHTNTNTTHTRMTHARTHKLKQWERRMGRVKGGRGEQERGLADLQRQRQQNPRVDSDTCVDTHKCTTAEQRGNEMEEGGDWGGEGEGGGGGEGKEREKSLEIRQACKDQKLECCCNVECTSFTYAYAWTRH